MENEIKIVERKGDKISFEGEILCKLSTPFQKISGKANRGEG